MKKFKIILFILIGIFTIYGTYLAINEHNYIGLFTIAALTVINGLNFKKIFYEKK